MRRLLTILLLASAASARAESPDLLEAYKREYAFLEAERAALEQRLAKVRAENKAEIDRAEGALVALDRETAALRVEADLIEEELSRLERESGAVGGREDALPEQLERAQNTLRVPIVAERPSHETIAALVEPTRLRLASLGVLSRERGEFYLPSGERVAGDVVRLGGVAAWGVSDQAAGALAPAGGGKLSLWNQPAEESARALGRGETPSTLEVLLWEKGAERMSPRVERDFVAYTEAGGDIAWVIVGVGALAALALLFRAFALVRPGPRRRFERDLDQLFARPAGNPDPTFLEERINALLLREAPRLERLQTVITVLAAIAPLLGLLGTVTGMIATFDVITEHGNSDPKLLSGGISEALITTEYGLMVAIPVLLLGTLLTARANHLKGNLERAAIDRLVAQLGQDEAASLRVGFAHTSTLDVADTPPSPA